MRLGTNALRGLPFAAGLVTIAVVLAGAAVYWNVFEQQRRYLASRNFRLLATIAEQVDSLLADRARFALARASERIDKSDTAGDSNPSPGRARAFRVSSQGEADVFTLAAATVGVPPESIGRTLLSSIFRPTLDLGAFDTIALATPNGRVLAAWGVREHELRAGNLDTIRPPGTTATFADVAQTITSREVVIAGVSYQMFVHPCCREADPAADETAGGVIVAGLVPSDALLSAALSISPTLVLIATLLVLIGALTGPFVKVACLGTRQRLTALDIVGLGFCGVAGLGMGTVLLLTFVFYARLNANLDRQLHSLAAEISESSAREIRDGFGHIRRLEQWMMDCESRSSAEHLIREDPCVAKAPGAQAPVAAGPRERAGAGDPYTSFALIDKNGLQTVKAGPSPAVRRFVTVSERGYFRDVIAGRAWHGVDGCDTPCIVSGLVTWTTGEMTGVITKPTGNPERPVATLAVPLRSLLGPLLPRGFEYAVIDAEGLVVFHSDVQRNGHENLFVESDGDRRLRAIVAARSAGPINLTYWGRPYRAFVLPMQVPGWSVVALAAKDGTRGLVLEATMAALLLLVALVCLWLVAMLVAILRKGVTWVWPDRLRRGQYYALLGLYLIVFAVFTGVLVFGSPGTVGILGFAVPVVTWGLTASVLGTRPDPSGVPARPEPLSQYRAVVTLFLVLTSIVPGVAFVTFSYNLHFEAFVKHRQLQMVRSLVQRPNENDATRYFGVFYASTIATTGSAPRDESRHQDDDLLLPILEDFLPYYSEASVEMRELLHDRADDGSWTSQRHPDGRLELRTYPRGSKVDGVAVRSWMPSPLRGNVRVVTSDASEGLESGPTAPAPGDGGEAELHHGGRMIPPALLLILAVTPLGLAYAIAGFVLKHVFLGQIAVPLWASGRLALRDRDRLLLLCHPPDMAAQMNGVVHLRLRSLAESGDHEAALGAALARAEPRLPIVIPDRDDCLAQPDLADGAATALRAMLGLPRPIVVLSKHPLDAHRELDQNGSASAPADVPVLEEFVLLDWRDKPGAAGSELDVSVIPPSAEAGWKSAMVRFLRRPWRWRTGPRLSSVEALLRAEERPLARLRPVARAIRESDTFRAGLLSRDQLLDEFEEGATPTYTELWEGCSEDEKVVLQHVGQFGLATAGSRRIVRRLIGKRLITKDPELRLMNRTFKRFVLAAERVQEVSRLEGLAEPSVWDRMRLPFALGAGAVCVFLFVTQREAFNTTVTALAGVSAAMPTLTRFVSNLASARDVKSGGNAPHI